MNILLAGDFFIADNFKNKPLIDGSVKKLFDYADYRIVNLEVPLTADIQKNKIFKTGPHLRSSADTLLPYMRQLKVDLVTLANNHILDYGSKGLSDTLNVLNKNQISYVGAGNNLQEAAKPFSIKKEGMKIAILNFTENEWSIAEEDKPGANPLDIIDNVHQIKAAKEAHDKVICVIHGGHEFYNLPSPRMVKQYRFYAENGANVIIGHHPHCISAYEIFCGTTIFYSLGNFIFTKPNPIPSWYEGLVLKLSFTQDKAINWELIPVKQDHNTFLVCKLEGIEKEKVFQTIDKLSYVLSDQKPLNKLFLDFAREKQNAYLNLISPVSAIPFRVIRKILFRFGINKRIMRKKQIASIYNLIRCESHNELFKESLNKQLS
jgi:poly-gamma-glutamate synthesis protein (capsule biosynthesis protein)